jgi:hypothetical protein
MWTKEEMVQMLHYLPKWRLARFLTGLEKPWNRYKREEFAELVCAQVGQNKELLAFILDQKDQEEAKEEFLNLYFKEHNTLPPALGLTDWVEALNDYKKRKMT